MIADRHRRVDRLGATELASLAVQCRAARSRDRSDRGRTCTRVAGRDGGGVRPDRPAARPARVRWWCAVDAPRPTTHVPAPASAEPGGEARRVPGRAVEAGSPAASARSTRHHSPGQVAASTPSAGTDPAHSVTAAPRRRLTARRCRSPDRTMRAFVPGLAGHPRSAPPPGRTAPSAGAGRRRGRFYFCQPSGDLRVPPGAASAVQAARRGSFDVDAIRRDFPILAERVNGRPLIWLDNAATTQKPQVVIDRLDLLLRARELQHPPCGARAGGARDRRLRGRARQGAAVHQRRARAEEIVFVRGTTEAINLVAKSWGRPHVGEGRRDRASRTWSTTRTSCRGSSWRRRRGHAPGRAGRRHGADILLDEYETAAQPTHQAGCAHPGLQRAGHRHAGRGDGRDRPSRRRARAGGRRAVRAAHARRRAGARLRLLRVLGPQGLRAHRDRRRVRHVRGPGRRRRRGRAAAT